MAEVELQQIGSYTISRLLSKSSTSNVYLGKQPRKKDVLIKLLHTPLDIIEAKEAFLSRAKQLKKLKHRNIVEVRDIGIVQDGGKQQDCGYLVMEYVAGKTLREHFPAGEYITPLEVKQILSPIADALHYAHVSNVLHGNLHPGNLLLGERKDPLLTGFSLMQQQISLALDDEESAIPYMAPEHLHGTPTAASDQYALAVMVYEWLCGRRPYEATTREQLLHQQEHDQFPLPRSLNEAISAAVESVLLRALARNPEQRFLHTLAFADAYLRTLMGLPLQPETPRTFPSLPDHGSAHDAGNSNVVKKGATDESATTQPSTTADTNNTNVGARASYTFGNDASHLTCGSSERKEVFIAPLSPRSTLSTSLDTPDTNNGNSIDAGAQFIEPSPPTSTSEQDALSKFSASDFFTDGAQLHDIVSADLCQGGILSESLPGYEERPAQIEMATLVTRSLTENMPAIIEAGTGTGKALDVDTPIPTPTGWKRMGDLVEGDFVFDERGHPTRVTAAFDVMYHRTCYEVVFSDGSSLIADAEHEWASYTHADRKWANRPKTGAYTLVTTERMATTLTVGSPPRANHAIAVAGPLVLSDVDLPIAPYFLGVWLGDDSCRNNQITTADPALVPAIYLRASEQQRRALLAGLLDTDGTVNRCGAVEFTTTNPRLAQDVYELVCSLGFRPSLRCGHARCRGKDCGTKWTLSFTTDEQVFRRERKVAAHKERLRNYSPERNRFRYVVAVREVPSRPVRCIQVESQSHLYLAGRSMIPTHNSLAYLVPIVRSDKVAIISTANKALQEQLFYKDIPFVQQHIKHFEAALVKGMANYVCLDRLDSERNGLQYYARNRDFTRLLNIVEDPASTFMGDFETLGFQLPGDIRSRVSTDSDQCVWKQCNFYEDCYVRKMREKAEYAQVIVVNHTLLLLDAAIGGFLLPARDVIVLDEAHHLEEEATRSFTVTISPTQITTLLSLRMLKDHSQVSLQDETNTALAKAWMRLEQVADPGYKGRANLQAPLEEGLKLASIITELADSLRKHRPKDLPEKESLLYDKLLKRTQNLSQNIRAVFSVDQPSKFVYYVERVNTPGRGYQLQVSAAPLDVTTWLRERLFDKCNVICTSATLATVGPNPARPEEKGPNFAYFRRRTGLDPVERPDVLERILPLSFDYESNALLYLPRDLPEPVYGAGSEDYTRSIAREMYKLVKASRGRAFLLFSSKRMLDGAYELMSPHLNFPLLRQGDLPRIELTRRFREETGAILFGLKSFWEGVDIAGEALSLVVIDKLPFDPPDDPVHEARVAQMKAAGENWFGTYVLPQAVLRLKQGLGRLLRTREDRGVMAILDTRLHTKGYGKLVLDALPPARRTSSIKEVERFFF